MSNRRYIKRVWRVPQDRGPVEYLATIIVKMLVKHGWPAKWQPNPYIFRAFNIYYEGRDLSDLPPDFAEAVTIATRIAARTYRIDISEDCGCVEFNRAYRVAPGGHFREVKDA